MAVLLNTEVAVSAVGSILSVHDNAEKALLTIRRSPGVANYPVRGVSGVRGVVVESDDGDDVVGQNVAVALRVDSTSVGLKIVSSHDGTRHRATVEDLRFDLVDTTNLSVLTNHVLLVVGDVVAGIISGVARSTGVEFVAHLVDGLVVIASLIDKTVGVGILPDTEVITTLAGTSITAVNDLLDRHVSGGEGTLASNVDTISEGRGDTMSPARTAVLGDVLVTDGGKVIPAIHVPPVNSDRDVVILLPRERGGDVLTPGGVSTELLIGNETVEVFRDAAIGDGD